MATTAFKENPVRTTGELPAEGTSAPAFSLVGTDLSEVSSETFAGRRVVLNIFPSVDTGVCAASVRRFCGAEGIENVVAASAFRSSFGEDFGLTQAEGPLQGLLARAVVVLDADGSVLHTQLVPEITTEPDYDAAVAALA